MDKILTHFSHLLIPTEEQFSAGKEIAEQIFHELHTKSKFSINRATIVGSTEKNTALKSYHDIDLAIFMNELNYPFDKVLEDFLQVIRSEVTSDVFIDTKPNRISLLKGSVKGIDFDISPAINFDSDQEKQRKKVMEQNEDPIEIIHKYCSSLIESRTQFVKIQSAFTHNLIRIAKY